MDRTLFKNKEDVIEGVAIDFVPVTVEDAEDIFKMRNAYRNMYFFNQQRELNINDQREWLESYEKRNNDIYWAIYDKNKVFIGTIRLYNINFEDGTCEQGSFMIDEAHAKEGPYAIEAELLSLDFAFETLKLRKIINCDRHDNKKMNSLTKKIGFEFIDIVSINGVDFNRYYLSHDNYINKRYKLVRVLDYWKER